MATGNPGAFKSRVEPSSADGQSLLRSIRSTYLDNQYKTRLQFKELCFINNDNLLRRFNHKKQRLFSKGGQGLLDEPMAFACFKKEESVDNIIRDGAAVKTSLYNYLGSSDLGVNLCRHADVQLKSAESGRSNVTKCWLLVFKVLPGKSRIVVADESVHFPSVGFDSHVSNTSPTASDPLHQQAINSQIYLFEFTGPTNSELSRYPSNVLPYAVLTFAKELSQPCQSAMPATPQTRLTQQPAAPLAHAKSQVTTPSVPTLPQHHAGVVNFLPGQTYRPPSSQTTAARDTSQQVRPPTLLMGGYVHGSLPPQAINSAPLSGGGNVGLLGRLGSQAAAGIHPHYRNFQQHQGPLQQMDMAFPPNRTATSSQLPFHVGATNAIQHAPSQLAHHNLAANRVVVQPHMDYGTGSYPLNLTQVAHGPTRSSRSSAGRKQPENMAGAGMRLPTAAQHYPPPQTSPRLSNAVTLAATSGISQNRPVNVITIQPEGKAPHEEPDYRGEWPWVKSEPVSTGYNEPASSFTNNLKDGGSVTNPIVIEPDELFLDLNTPKNAVMKQITELQLPSTCSQDAKVTSEPVCDRDEFQKLYGSLSPDHENSNELIEESPAQQAPANALGMAGSSFGMFLPVTATSPLEQKDENLSSVFPSVTTNNSLVYSSASAQAISQHYVNTATAEISGGSSTSIWQQLKQSNSEKSQHMEIGESSQQQKNSLFESVEVTREINVLDFAETVSPSAVSASKEGSQTDAVVTNNRVHSESSETPPVQESSQNNLWQSSERDMSKSNITETRGSSSHVVSVCGTWSIPTTIGSTNNTTQSPPPLMSGSLGLDVAASTTSTLGSDQVVEERKASPSSEADTCVDKITERTRSNSSTVSVCGTWSVPTETDAAEVVGTRSFTSAPVNMDNLPSLCVISTCTDSIAQQTTTCSVFTSLERSQIVCDSADNKQLQTSSNDDRAIECSSLDSHAQVCSSKSSIKPIDIPSHESVTPDSYVTAVSQTVDGSVMSAYVTSSCSQDETPTMAISATVLAPSGNTPLNLVISSPSLKEQSSVHTTERSLGVGGSQSCNIGENVSLAEAVVVSVPDKILAQQHQTLHELQSVSVEDTAQSDSVEIPSRNKTVTFVPERTEVTQRESLGQTVNIASSNDVTHSRNDEKTQILENVSSLKDVCDTVKDVADEPISIDNRLEDKNALPRSESNDTVSTCTTKQPAIGLSQNHNTATSQPLGEGDCKTTENVNYDAVNCATQSNSEVIQVCDTSMVKIDNNNTKVGGTVHSGLNTKTSQERQVCDEVVCHISQNVQKTSVACSDNTVELKGLGVSYKTESNVEVKTDIVGSSVPGEHIDSILSKSQSSTKKYSEGILHGISEQGECVKNHQQKQIKTAAHTGVSGEDTISSQLYSNSPFDDSKSLRKVDNLSTEGHTRPQTRSQMLRKDNSEEKGVNLRKSTKKQKHSERNKHQTAPPRDRMTKLIERQKVVVAENGSINLVVETVYNLVSESNSNAMSMENYEVTIVDSDSNLTENNQAQPAVKSDQRRKSLDYITKQSDESRRPCDSVAHSAAFSEEDRAVNHIGHKLAKRVPVNSFTEREARLTRKMPVSKKSTTPSNRSMMNLKTKKSNENTEQLGDKTERSSEAGRIMSASERFTGLSYTLPEGSIPQVNSDPGLVPPQVQNMSEQTNSPASIVEETIQTKEYQPVVLLKYDIGHLLQDYSNYNQDPQSTTVQANSNNHVYNDAGDTTADNELNLKISAVTSLEANTAVAEAFQMPSTVPLYDEDTVSEREWQINGCDEDVLQDSASMSMSDGDMPSNIRKITLRKTGHVKEALQITIKATKPSSDVTFDTEGKDMEQNKDASSMSPVSTRKTSLRRKKSVNYRETIRKKHLDLSDSGTDLDDRIAGKNTRKTRASQRRSKESINIAEKNVQVNNKEIDIYSDKKRKGTQYKSKEFVESSSETEIEESNVQKSAEKTDGKKQEKAQKEHLEDKGKKKHKKKKHKKSKHLEIENKTVASPEKETKCVENNSEKVNETLSDITAHKISETLKHLRREMDFQDAPHDDNVSSLPSLPSHKDSIDSVKKKDDSITSLPQAEKTNENDSEKTKALSKRESQNDEKSDKFHTRKRAYFRSKSRSPDVSRRKRPRSRSRSRSYSPHSRKGRYFRRRYSRSPSPRKRHSRSPRRRYSRSPSPYSRQGRRRGRYSPRRKHSRSPSPRSRRRSRSSSPYRRYSRSPSQGRLYSRSRSPSPSRKRFTAAPVKTGKERPYSPSSPTKSPTRSLSPTQNTKMLVEKMGRTATDELFDIAFGKTPTVHVQGTQQVAEVPTPVVSVAETTPAPATPPSDVLELFSPAYADNKNKTGKTPPSEEKPSPPKKLTISQYKSRKSLGDGESDGKVKRKGLGENKVVSNVKRVHVKRSSTDSNNSKSSDDADIVMIQRQYNILKDTVESWPSDDEGKIDIIIEYKRVGEELKNLRAKHSGKAETVTSLALPAMSIATSVVTTTATMSSAQMSPRKRRSSSSSPRKLFGKLNEQGEIFKPEWELNSMDPEAGTTVEKFDGYSGKSQTSGTTEKSTTSKVIGGIDIGNILEKLGLTKSLPENPVPSAGSSAVQNILSLAKSCIELAKTSTIPEDNRTPSSAPVKPLMDHDVATPTLRSLMNARNPPKQPPLPPPVKPPPLPPTEISDHPVFFTDINNARVNSVGSKAPKSLGGESRRTLLRDPRLAKQISVDSTPVALPRDPRLSRQTSYSSDITGQSPRDQVGMLSPRGVSPRGGVSPLTGMASPTHISPRQQQQQQYYHPTLPPIPPPHFGNNPQPLPLIPIDIPEISYEGIQGSLDDPRFMPRDTCCWNERPVRHPRIIPWDNATEIEEVEMEIVGETEEGYVEACKSNVKASTCVSQEGTIAKNATSIQDSKDLEHKSEDRKRHSSADVKKDKHLHKCLLPDDQSQITKLQLKNILEKVVTDLSSDKIEESSSNPILSSSGSPFQEEQGTEIHTRPKITAENPVEGSVPNETKTLETVEQKTTEASVRYYNPKDSLRTSGNFSAKPSTAMGMSSVNYPGTSTDSKTKLVSATKDHSVINSTSNSVPVATEKILKDTSKANIQTKKAVSTGQEIKRSKGTLAASRWSSMSANWTSKNANRQTHQSDSDVGEADYEVLNNIDALEQESEHWYNKLSIEMNRQLDVRLCKIVEKKLYHDPTEGVTSSMRERLLRDKTLNAKVLQELQIEHNLSKLLLNSGIPQVEKELAELRKQQAQHGSTPDIMTNITKRLINLHGMQLACMQLHKRMETDLHRFQKSDYVEVVPEEFLLEGERFVSKEGCLLFLVEKFTIHDCTRLYAYKLEIDMCQAKLFKTKPSVRTEIKNLNTYLGYWHSQRKQLLQSLCCHTKEQHRRLVQKLKDRLTWCRVVQEELETKTRTNTEEVMLGFLLTRIENLMTYLANLEKAKFKQNVWEVCRQNRDPDSALIATSDPHTLASASAPIPVIMSKDRDTSASSNTATTEVSSTQSHSGNIPNREDRFTASSQVNLNQRLEHSFVSVGQIPNTEVLALKAQNQSYKPFDDISASTRVTLGGVVSDKKADISKPSSRSWSLSSQPELPSLAVSCNPGVTELCADDRSMDDLVPKTNRTEHFKLPSVLPSALPSHVDKVNLDESKTEIKTDVVVGSAKEEPECKNLENKHSNSDEKSTAHTVQHVKPSVVVSSVLSTHRRKSHEGLAVINRDRKKSESHTEPSSNDTSLKSPATTKPKSKEFPSTAGIKSSSKTVDSTNIVAEEKLTTDRCKGNVLKAKLGNTQQVKTATVKLSMSSSHRRKSNDSSSISKVETKKSRAPAKDSSVLKPMRENVAGTEISERTDNKKNLKESYETKAPADKVKEVPGPKHSGKVQEGTQTQNSTEKVSTGKGKDQLESKTLSHKVKEAQQKKIYFDKLSQIKTDKTAQVGSKASEKVKEDDKMKEKFFTQTSRDIVSSDQVKEESESKSSVGKGKEVSQTKHAADKLKVKHDKKISDKIIKESLKFSFDKVTERSEKITSSHSDKVVSYTKGAAPSEAKAESETISPLSKVQSKSSSTIDMVNPASEVTSVFYSYRHKSCDESTVTSKGRSKLAQSKVKSCTENHSEKMKLPVPSSGIKDCLSNTNANNSKNEADVKYNSEASSAKHVSDIQLTPSKPKSNEFSDEPTEYVKANQGESCLTGPQTRPEAQEARSKSEEVKSVETSATVSNTILNLRRKSHQQSSIAMAEIPLSRRGNSKAVTSIESLPSPKNVKSDIGDRGNKDDITKDRISILQPQKTSDDSKTITTDEKGGSDTGKDRNIPEKAPINLSDALQKENPPTNTKTSKLSKESEKSLKKTPIIIPTNAIISPDKVSESFASKEKNEKACVSESEKRLSENDPRRRLIVVKGREKLQPKKSKPVNIPTSPEVISNSRSFTRARSCAKAVVCKVITKNNSEQISSTPDSSILKTNRPISDEPSKLKTKQSANPKKETVTENPSNQDVTDIEISGQDKHTTEQKTLETVAPNRKNFEKTLSKKSPTKSRLNAQKLKARKTSVANTSSHAAKSVPQIIPTETGQCLSGISSVTSSPGKAAKEERLETSKDAPTCSEKRIKPEIKTSVSSDNYIKFDEDQLPASSVKTENVETKKSISDKTIQEQEQSSFETEQDVKFIENERKKREEMTSRKRNRSFDELESEIHNKRIKIEEKYTRETSYGKEKKQKSEIFSPSSRTSRSLSSQQRYDRSTYPWCLSQRETHSDSDSHRRSSKYRPDSSHRDSKDSSPGARSLAYERLKEMKCSPAKNRYDKDQCTSGSRSPRLRSRSRERYLYNDRKPDTVTRLKDDDRTPGKSYLSSARRYSADYNRSPVREMRNVHVSRSPESRSSNPNLGSPKGRSWSRERSPSPDSKAWLRRNRAASPEGASYTYNRRQSWSSERQYSPYKMESNSGRNRYPDERTEPQRDRDYDREFDPPSRNRYPEEAEHQLEHKLDRDYRDYEREVLPPREVTPPPQPVSIEQPVLRRSPRKGHKREWSSSQDRENYSTNTYEIKTIETYSKRGRGSRGRPRGRPRGRGRGRGKISPTRGRGQDYSRVSDEADSYTADSRDWSTADERRGRGSALTDSESPSSRGNYRGGRGGRGRARAIQNMRDAIDKATDVINQAMMKMSGTSVWTTGTISAQNVASDYRGRITNQETAFNRTQEVEGMSHDVNGSGGGGRIPSLVSSVPGRSSREQTFHNDQDYRFTQQRSYYS